MKGIQQQFKPQAVQTRPHMPSVVQSKNAPAAPNVRRPVAPPVYRSQSKLNAMQQKTAHPSQIKTHPVAPPVYRPQPTPKVLQTKAAMKQQPSVGQTNRAPVAPPVYRPQALPKVLQTKADVKGEAALNRPVLRISAAKPAAGLDNVRGVVQRQNSVRPPQVQAAAAAGRLNISKRGESQVIQRLVLAMGNDQAHAASVLAKSREGLFSSAEAYNLFDGYPDLTKNNDKNITLWGHAGQYSYGDRSVDELVEALLAKNLDTSGHTVLELIGCAPNNTSEKSTETYAQLLQQTLNERIKRKITVKTFPMPAPGGDSTNYRFDTINKFVYIYGEMEAHNAADAKYDLMKKIHPDKQTFYDKFIEYLKTVQGLQYKTGNYSSLRSYLVETNVVKTHKKEGLFSAKTVENQLLIKDVYGT